MKLRNISGAICSIVLGLTLLNVSCVRSDQMDSTSSPIITFSPQISVSQTKGVPIVDSNLESTFLDFGVFATTSTASVLDNVEVARSGSSWVYSPEQYWSGSEVNFLAYAPYPTTDNGVSAALNTSGDLTVSYAVPTSVANQPDITIAAPVAQSSGAVDLTFSHVLSSIGFKMKGNPACELVSISIGGISESGVATQDSSTGAVTWSLSDPTTTEFAVGLDSSVASPPTSGESVSVMASDGYLMMLPQTLTSSAELIISILNSSSESLTSRFSFGDKASWEANKQYTYTITLNSDQIIFDNVVVEAWEDDVDIEFDEEGNPIMPTDNIVTMDEYTDESGNFDSDLFIETLKVIEAEGYDTIIYSGDYVDGIIGSGFSMYSNVASRSDESEMYNATNPQVIYAPSVTTVDFSGMNNFDFLGGIFLCGMNENATSDADMLNSCSISTVILPSYITELPMFAFVGSSLDSFYNENITSAQIFAFAFCSTLSSLELPNATYVDSGALFYNSSLTTLTLTAAGDITADFSNIEGFDSTLCDLKLNIDKASGEASPAVSGTEWAGAEWKSISYVDSSGTTIDGNIDLSTYGGSVTELQADITARYSKGIRSFTVSGEYFEGCFGSAYSFTALEQTLTFSDNPFVSADLYEIAAIDLTGVTNLTAIPGKAFYDPNGVYLNNNIPYSKLKSVKLPASVTSVGDLAFAGCAYLEYLDMPGVTSLGVGFISALYNISSTAEIRLTSSQTISFTPYGETGSISTELSMHRYIDDCKLVIHSNNIDTFGVSGLIATNFSGEDYEWGSILTVDDNGEYESTNGVIDLDIYNTQEKVIAALSSNESAGVVDYIIVGAAFNECFGSGGSSDDFYSGDAENVNLYFINYAPSMETIDLSGAETADNENFDSWYVTGLFASCLDMNGDTYVESKLREVILPSEATYVPYAAFANCTSLEKVTLNTSTSTIRSYAFYNCASLVSIENLSNVNSVGLKAFAKCGIETIAFSEYNYVTFSESAFQDCTSLKSFRGNCYTVSTSLFSGCTALESVTFPTTYVEWINGYAFENCTKLSSINGAKGVDFSIGSWTNVNVSNNAFYNCTAIETFIFPASFNLSYSSAFSGCAPKAITTYATSNFQTSAFDGADLSGCTLTFINGYDASSWENYSAEDKTLGGYTWYDIIGVN